MGKGPFKLRSGNKTPFKQMGSSPLKDEEEKKKKVEKYDRRKSMKEFVEEVEGRPEAFSEVKLSLKEEEKKEEVKESGLPPKSEWPASGTQARRNFYKKHNLKFDSTTDITPATEEIEPASPKAPGGGPEESRGRGKQLKGLKA